MGGGRLVVYLRPRLFPTDFFCVSDWPGGRKALVHFILAILLRSESVLTCSHSGSCLLVSGHTPLEPREEGDSC